jgi:cobalt/nickel transport protein
MHRSVAVLSFLLVPALLLALALPARAHFGMVVPDHPLLTQDQRSTEVTLSFSHPAEGVGMELVKPRAFYAAGPQGTQDLLPALEQATVMDHTGWKASFAPKRPGVYQLVMEPQPYWEPAEDCHIVHLTKVFLPAFGGEEGWDQPVGLQSEIVPLTRPFGNYAGNLFQGVVLMDGKPVPHAEVEVEYYQGGALGFPSDYHITQVVRADAAGVFSWACPRSGWWGFAALNTADHTLPDPEGNPKDVELGAVLWTYMHAWPAN